MMAIIIVSPTQITTAVFRSNDNFELYTTPFNTSVDVTAPRDIVVSIKARFDSI